MTLRSLLLGSLCVLHFANAYAIQDGTNNKNSSSIFVINKAAHHSSGFIGKELNKQKQSVSTLNTDIEDIKLLSTIHVQPTQSFFAYQHERFSRFWQSLFSSPNS